MTEVSLAELGTHADAELDPRVRDRNLAALRQSSDDYADLIERAARTPHYRAVTALDGSVTLQFKTAESPDAWIAATALPLRRAQALCGLYQTGDLNATLPTVAAGAELRILLDRLPRYRAVFVFEENLARVAAVLSIHDFADDLRRGRCIFLPPQGEELELERLLDAHAGLLPPGNILCPPEVSADRIEHVRGVCMRVAARTARQRSDRIGALAQSYASAVVQPDKRRLVILAIAPDPPAVRAAECLAAAARNLGLETCSRTLTGPRDVHLLNQCEAISEFSPTISICVNHSRGLLPLPLRETACEWVINPETFAARDADAADVRLAASPMVLARLEADQGRSEPSVPFFWSCDSQPRPTGSASDAIAIVGDLADDSPEACGIEQPTHKLLWTQLRALARKGWGSEEPFALLAKAERDTGLRVGEPTLREKLLHIIERVLIPTAVMERICQTLRDEATPAVAIGNGWQRWSDQALTRLADNLDEYLTREDRIEPRAAILVGGPDPLRGELPIAGSLGWPILLHQPAGCSLAKTLGGVLVPEQHVRPFSSAKSLRNAIRDLAADPEKGRALGERARQHLLAHHTHEHRLRTLLDTLDNAPAGRSG